MILAGSTTCEICQIEPALYNIDFTTLTGYGSWYTCPLCTDLFKKRRPYALVVPLLTEEEARNMQSEVDQCQP